MLYAVKMGQGVKRKLEDIELEKSPGNQRQSILDISVGKLQTKNVKRVEPPLLRSVLILNTLKHIESELLKEGMQSPTTCSTFSIPEVDPNSTVIDFLPEQDDHPGMEISTSQPSQTGPLPSIDTFVGPKLSYPEVKMLETINEKSPIASVTEASLTLYQSSSLQMEEILNDFDFSVCDYDMFSSLSNGMKLTPLSAEEVLHSFPNPNTTCAESYANLVNAPLTFCKGESFDDLDNIMQILVGS